MQTKVWVVLFIVAAMVFAACGAPAAPAAPEAEEGAAESGEASAARLSGSCSTCLKGTRPSGFCVRDRNPA